MKFHAVQCAALAWQEPANPEMVRRRGCIMSASAVAIRKTYSQSWRDLYRIAMSETDLHKLPARIAEAETALTTQARELIYVSGDTLEEKESLDDAMCILHALRSSLKRRTSGVQNASDYDRLKMA